MSGSLKIVGSGIFAPNQMTLETVEALKEAEVILHAVGHSPETIAFLSQFGEKVSDISHLYVENKRDIDVYRSIAEYVMLSARSRRTCFMVHGHPLIYVAPVSLILKACERDSISVSVYPAVSSLDTMLLQIGIDIGRHGLQVYDCNRLVYYEIAPNSGIPLVLMQPGCFDSGIITRNAINARARFVPLSAYLQGHYPVDHRCYILASQFVHGVPARCLAMTIATLPDFAGSIDYASSLYVPPVITPTVKNVAMYEGLLDPLRVQEIIES